MTLLRLFLVVFLVVLSVYTAIVIANHGLNLFAVFFGDMMALNWAGQFNLDFTGFLFLSAFWVSWRHHYSAAGLGLAVVAFFGGMGFLTVYLLYWSIKVEGDMKRLLLGEQRAAA